MECDYCGKELQKTKGKMLVLANGETKFFCSSKCQKNWEKNRNHKYPQKEENQ